MIAPALKVVKKLAANTVLVALDQTARQPQQNNI